MLSTLTRRPGAPSVASLPSPIQRHASSRLPPASAGHSLGRLSVLPPSPAGSASAPVQLAKPKRVKIASSRGRFARRWQAAYGSAKNLATLKLRHKLTNKVLYVNAESLGMGNKSFTSPYERVRTKAGTKKRRKHSEAQLLLAVQNQKIQKGKKVIDLSNYEREWAFSTNQACGSGGEGCGSEVVPSLMPGDKPFYFQNEYKGSNDAGGFGKSYNQFYKNEDSDTESEDEKDIENVLMIQPEMLRGVDFKKTDTIPVTDLNSFLAKGKHARLTKGGRPTARWRRYQGRKKWGR